MPFICAVLVFLSWSLSAHATPREALQKASPSREKVAFLASFTSPVTSHVLTDLNLEKGYRVFAHVHPDFEKSIEVIKFDNQGEPKNIPGQVDKIVASKIRYVLGVSKTSQALVAAPLSDQHGFLMLTPLATNDKVTENHGLVARACFSDSQQGKTLARFALSELKAKRVLVLTNVDTPYSIGLSQTFRLGVEKRATVRELKYAADDIRVAALEAEIAQYKPDLVFIPDYVNTASLLIKELYRIDPKLTLLGGDGWGGREVLDPTIKPMPNLRAFYTTVWNQGLSAPVNRVFVKAHLKVFPAEAVSIGAATMYDTLTIFWDAYQAAKAPKTPQSVKAQLLAKSFNTTTGTIRFTDPKDLTPARKVVIIRLNAGKHELYKSF